MQAKAFTATASMDSLSAPKTKKKMADGARRELFVFVFLLSLFFNRKNFEIYSHVGEIPLGDVGRGSRVKLYGNFFFVGQLFVGFYIMEDCFSAFFSWRFMGWFICFVFNWAGFWVEVKVEILQQEGAAERYEIERYQICI